MYALACGEGAAALGPSRWDFPAALAHPAKNMVTLAVVSCGFGVALMHFVVSQVLLSDLAGPFHTATLTNAYDALGFAVLGPFQGGATYFGSQDDWRFFAGGILALGFGTGLVLWPLAAMTPQTPAPAAAPSDSPGESPRRNIRRLAEPLAKDGGGHDGSLNVELSSANADA